MTTKQTFVIVGLGNPGKRYEQTYHNTGFNVVDKLAKDFGVKFSKRAFEAKIAVTSFNGANLLICKPQTFMNNSGKSVAALVNYYKLPTENLLLVYDDYDLDIGTIRFRESGSAGTHNGMRDIVYQLGTGDFPRVRIGIKPQEEVMPIIDYVLSKVNGESPYSDSIIAAAERCKQFLSEKTF